jgi:hypothetical protein
MFVGLLVAFSIDAYKINKFNEFEGLNDEAIIATDLNVDPQKLNFMVAHSFSEAGEDFQKFVHRLGNDINAKVGSIQILEESTVGLLNMRKVDIPCLFWHETLIFEFLKKLQEFKPGLLKISFVDITKFAKVSDENPALKLQVICNIYQK